MRTRHRLSPLAAGAIGFLAGIAVWHALGFWAFLTAVVSGQPTASSTVLASLLLGKPAGQLAAERSRLAVEAAVPALDLAATPTHASSQGCITLARRDGARLVAQLDCPPGAGSVVSRRLAARADRLPVRLQHWATETTAGQASPAAAAQDRVEAATVMAPSPASPGVDHWAPTVTASERAIITGSVR